MTTWNDLAQWPKALKEFPDYLANDLPAMPAGFVDASWHNDTCPSAHNAEARLTVWCDYTDEAKREFPEDAGRFSLCRTDEHGATVEGIGAATDDWTEMLALIDATLRG